MTNYLVWMKEHWISGVLIVGVLLAIWYVGNHRDKLLLNKQLPPKD